MPPATVAPPDRRECCDTRRRGSGVLRRLQRRSARAARRARFTDYVDYGHTQPGHGQQGARDDYENAVHLAGGVTRYNIEALVAGEDTVAVSWTGHLPNGSDYRGLSLYRVADGRITEARNTFIDPPVGG